MDPYATSHFSNDALRRDLKTRVANDCKSTAVLLSRIGEFDERRLYLEDGYASMHSYCVRELHFCEGTASWRIYAARAARRFPVLYDAVADGRLHLTAVVMLSRYLTSGNVDELVAAATHRSKAEIERLIADRFPRPDLPERLAAIPPPVATAGAPSAAYWPANTGPASPATAPAIVPSTHPYGPADADNPLNSEPASGSVPLDSPVGAEAGGFPVTSPASGPTGPYWPANTAAPGPRTRVRPLAPERFGLQVTLDQETYELLQEARALMSHQNPGGEIAPVLKRALQHFVAHLQQRKFAATARPRSASQRPAPESADGSVAARHIPAKVKRAVRERDEGRCTFVSDAGKRCGARTLLEFDHAEPVARGGRSTVDNVRLRCRLHNRYEAERVFGVEFMERKRGAVAFSDRT
jgi:hypothetical protein